MTSRKAFNQAPWSASLSLRAAAAAAAVLACMAGCGPTTRAPLDPSSAPQGSGWHCYQHAEPGTVSLGICYRDAAQCTAKGANDGGKVCKPQVEAFCTDLRPRSASHDVRCVATMADCDELARNFEGLGPSLCAAIP